VGRIEQSAPALLVDNQPPPMPVNIGKPLQTSRFLQEHGIYLQAGAFTNRQNVDVIASQLKMLGLDSTVLEPKGEGKFYRVLVGPFADEKEASLAKARLDKIGINSFFVKS
jgi:cell division protein FtsN